MDKVSQPIDKGLLAETNILILKHPLLEIVFYISVTTSVVWLGDWELFYDVRHGTLPGDLFITKFSLVGLMVKLSRSQILYSQSQRRCWTNPPAVMSTTQIWNKIDACFDLDGIKQPRCNPRQTTREISCEKMRWWGGQKCGYCTLAARCCSQRTMITRCW